MKIKLKGMAVMAVLATTFLLAACASQQAGDKKTESTSGKTVAAARGGTTEGANAATEKKAAPQAAGAALYEVTPPPLKPVDCGHCHVNQFTDLKKSKTKHRFDCKKCHTQFHVYNPRKKNYERIMPKCTRCHGLKHGEAFPNCMECHQNPHSPRTIAFSQVEKKIKGKDGKPVVSCAVCHSSEGTEFAKYPTKHNVEVNCQGCHADKHGYIPSCLDCHEPHVEGQAYKDCLVCHSPHSAKRIKKYPEDTPSNVCGSCHTQIYSNLQTNHTKHSELHCATCHVKHGQIPKCQQCHGLPHGKALHKRFPKCLECHKDPHNLPVNRNK